MIAFVMTAHQEPEIVARTVAHLAPHPVFVHVDAKAGLGPAWSQVGAELVESRRPVYWGGRSPVLAALDLARTALTRFPEVTHVVYLSGACYPLRPVEELEAFLRAAGEQNLVTTMPMPPGTDIRRNVDDVTLRDGLLPWRWIVGSRLAFEADRALRKVLSVVLTLLNRVFRWHRWPQDIEPRYGNAHWVLTRETAEAVLGFTASRAGRRLLRYMRGVQAPDEIYVQSVVPALGFPAGSIPYERFGNYRTANLHVIHPTLGHWYGIDDLPELTASGRFFVRKVRAAESGALLDALDSHIAARRARPAGPPIPEMDPAVGTLGVVRPA